MYKFDFKATDDADFAVTLDLTDDTTGQAWDDAASMEFTVQVTEDGAARLTAKTADGSMTRPATNQVSWRFTAAQMRNLCAGRTYSIGVVWEDGGGHITQLGHGTVAVIDGGLA